MSISQGIPTDSSDFLKVLITSKIQLSSRQAILFLIVGQLHRPLLVDSLSW